MLIYLSLPLWRTDTPLACVDLVVSLCEAKFQKFHLLHFKNLIVDVIDWWAIPPICCPDTRPVTWKMTWSHYFQAWRVWKRANRTSLYCSGSSGFLMIRPVCRFSLPKPQRLAVITACIYSPCTVWDCSMVFIHPMLETAFDDEVFIIWIWNMHHAAFTHGLHNSVIHFPDIWVEQQWERRMKTSHQSSFTTGHVFDHVLQLWLQCHV